MNKIITATIWNSTLAIMFAPNVKFSSIKKIENCVSCDENSILIYTEDELIQGGDVKLKIFVDEHDELMDKSPLFCSNVNLLENPSFLLFGEAYSGMNEEDLVELESESYSAVLYKDDEYYVLLLVSL